MALPHSLLSFPFPDFVTLQTPASEENHNLLQHQLIGNFHGESFSGEDVLNVYNRS